jgi:hypothetical protein
MRALPGPFARWPDSLGAAPGIDREPPGGDGTAAGSRRTPGWTSSAVDDCETVIVNKPWGCEYLMYKNSQVAVWNLFIREGAETSMHCHPRKKTGLILLAGEALLSFLNDSHPIQALAKSMIRQGLFHSTAAVSTGGISVIETETPTDKADLVRLTDKYGREGSPYEGPEEWEPMDERCVLLDVPVDSSSLAYRLGGCVLRMERFTDISGFMSRPPGQVVVVLEGGLESHRGVAVLGPGDIVWSHNLTRLTESFVSPRGATVLTIERNQ